MNSKTALLIAFAFGLAFSACKKDDANNAPVSYEQLGDTRANYISGFAFNGDPLTITAAGENLRWRVSARQWERVGAGIPLPKESKIRVLGEDAAGAYYGLTTPTNGSGEMAGLFELRAGGTAWQPLKFPGGDSMAFVPVANLLVNGTGDVVITTNRVFPNGEKSSLYHKAAGTAT